MVKRGKSSRKVMNKRTDSGRPLGVKIISVLSYVISAVLLIMSIFLFGASALLSTEDAQALVKSFVEDSTASTTIANGVTLGIAVGGVVFLIFALLFFFVARGLWKGKNWARVVMIILAALGFVGALADILRGDILANVLDLLINGWIAGYLLFSKKVQSAFR